MQRSTSENKEWYCRSIKSPWFWCGLFLGNGSEDCEQFPGATTVCEIFGERIYSGILSLYEIWCWGIRVLCYGKATHLLPRDMDLGPHWGGVSEDRRWTLRLLKLEVLIWYLTSVSLCLPWHGCFWTHLCDCMYLFPIYRESGSSVIHLTTPDTITSWETEAFCLSKGGLGLATPPSLTVFQPFFVELTLPHSIIRGERFELKASVVNYEPKCIMVGELPAEVALLMNQLNLHYCHIDVCGSPVSEWFCISNCFV